MYSTWIEVTVEKKKLFKVINKKNKAASHMSKRLLVTS